MYHYIDIENGCRAIELSNNDNILDILNSDKFYYKDRIIGCMRMLFKLNPIKTVEALENMHWVGIVNSIIVEKDHEYNLKDVITFLFDIRKWRENLPITTFRSRMPSNSIGLNIKHIVSLLVCR